MITLSIEAPVAVPLPQSYLELAQEMRARLSPTDLAEAAGYLLDYFEGRRSIGDIRRILHQFGGFNIDMVPDQDRQLIKVTPGTPQRAAAHLRLPTTTEPNRE